MIVRRFEAAGLAQYSYLIASEGLAAVIDPIRDIDQYLEFAAGHRLRIVWVLETHIHADFASGATALAARTGAQLAVSAYDRGEIYACAFPHRALRDGEVLELGGVRLQALHTPGHTPEHLSFLLHDTFAPIALFSGDFLFVGSIGRPDLLGDEAKTGLAHALYRSFHRGIASLPDHLTLYPGHGSGSLCGAHLGDMPSSTLGHERANNALLQLDESAFVAEVLAGVPPMPAYYPRMKSLNALGAPVLNALPGEEKLSSQRVRNLLATGALLVDLRKPEEFAAAHICGAVNIGSGASFPLWAGWLLSADAPLILMGDDAAVSQARTDLIRVGLDGAIGHLNGGIQAWKNAGLPTASLCQVGPRQLSPDAIVVDVRHASEWRDGHLPRARHEPLGGLTAALRALDPGRPLVTVCASGYRSSLAASLLLRVGFRNVCSLVGGTAACRTEGVPLVTA